MSKLKFNFGSIVVVEDIYVGVVVKCWGASNSGSKRPAHYEVYVRSFNQIKEYNEDDIESYIYDKELEDRS